MFARRTPMTLPQKALAWLWPRGGWKRGGSYILHRLKRLPGTPESIAAGVAIGVAVSFTPFFGFHLMIAGLIAWVIRANVMGALIGTAVGNPWTFPFLLWLEYKVGFLLLRMDTQDVPDSAFNFEGLMDMPQDQIILLLLPTALGGLVLSLAAFAATYYPVRSLVRRYQKGRLEKRLVALERKRAKAEARAEKLSEKIAATTRKKAVRDRAESEREKAEGAREAAKAESKARKADLKTDLADAQSLRVSTSKG